MAIDDVPPVRGSSVVPAEEPHPYRGILIGICIVLALLVIGEIYSLSQISSMRASLAAENAAAQKQLFSRINDQFSSRLAALESSSAQQISALKDELDAAAKRMGSTGNELRRARVMVSELQAAQEQTAAELKQELAQKADAQQVGTLSQDLSGTKTDLASTKKQVSTLASDLGMARSELGTLIARNHDDIETLRKLGERNYYEFTLTRNQEQKVAGVGLVLKKTNVKHNRFNLNLLVNDTVIPKDGRTIDEPIFFTTSGSKGFYELVINKVERDKVIGYLSTPKFNSEMANAANSEATR